MTKPTKMSTPVTRGEVQQELQEFKQELDGKLANFATKADLANFATKADLANFATKAELELWGGALLARIEKIGQQLQADLARHAGGLREWMSTLMSAHDEKYADLPGRVNRLEATVFGDERR